MIPIPEAFEFDYFDSTITYGRGAIGSLGSFLDSRGFESALLVCGKHTGANDVLMGPIFESLGDRLAGVYDGATSDKTVADVFGGIEIMQEVDPDVAIGVGGGSNLDVARQIGIFAADGRSQTELREAARDGQLEDPDQSDPVLPAIVVPTTLPGADLSAGGSIEILPASESPTGQPIFRKGANMPIGLFYDPTLFETTPTSALVGSVMNGFNKGLESIYSANPNVIVDGTAIHGLRLLREGIPGLRSREPAAIDRSVLGLILVQFGRTLSVIHAFAHGFSRRYSIQQGVIHAILAPHVLEYVLASVDARRELLAFGLGVDTDGSAADEMAASIVNEVATVRDSLGIETKFRDLEMVDPDDFPAIAEFILNDGVMANGPPTLDPTQAEIEAVLDNAW